MLLSKYFVTFIYCILGFKSIGVSKIIISDEEQSTRRNKRIDLRKSDEKTSSDNQIFPKIVHQTYRNSNLTKEYGIWRQRCIDINPDYEFKLWTDYDNRELVKNHVPQFLNLYDSYNEKIKRIDMIRLVYLYVYGGLYMDLDFICLRPFKDLFSTEYFTVAKMDNIVTPTYGQRYSNAFMAAPANNLIVKILMSRLHIHAKKPVLEATGPLFITSSLATLEKSKWLALPFEKIFGAEWNSKQFCSSLHECMNNFPDAITISVWTHSWGKHGGNKRKWIENNDTHVIPSNLNFSRLFHIETKCHVYHKLKGQVSKRVNDPIEPDLHICLDNIQPTCVVYSFGIAYNWIFDDVMLNKGCHVYSYDPSMNVGKHSRRPGFHLFEPIGIGSYTGFHKGISTLYGGKRSYPVYTLEDLMKRNNHTHIDLIRMDVESAEWDILENWKENNMFDRFDQLLMEIHMWKTRGEKVVHLNRKQRYITAINDIPLDLFYFQRNSWNNESIDTGITKVYELGFIRNNKKFDETKIDTHYKFIKSLNSNGWSMWNQKEVIGSGTCRWVNYKVRDRTTRMCVHEKGELVSDVISREGHWKDCDILLELWGKVTNGNVHIEIGANIGSCILHVLLHTNANVIAFEPQPKNLHKVTSTLLAMGESYSSRLFLFPIGLGNINNKLSIYSADNNMGNSVLGKSIEDKSGQHFLPPIEVSVERLDTIIWDNFSLPVMKMDAQGFECNVMRGFGNLAINMRIIKTEIAPHWLNNQEGCSVRILIDLAKELGFDIFDESFRPLTVIPTSGVQDILLIKKSELNN